jgi:hypothetical protein
VIPRQTILQRLTEAVSGLKTILTAVVLIALGLAQEFQAIDLKPIFTLLFGEDVATKLMIFMPVVFVVLRVVSTTPIRWRSECDDPDKRKPF